MDERRLRILVTLSRLGSMHEVADELGTTTSNVSQSIAALGREVGAAMVEPVGRGVRLTAAGRRLCEHATTILAALAAARLDLDPAAEPTGTVRVAAFATAIGRSLVPVIEVLRTTCPAVELQVQEREPPEALDLLTRDAVDLALVYDYNLAPARWGREHVVTALWESDWGLAARGPDESAGLEAHAASSWIVNSRHSADEDVLRTLASIAGFVPRVVHRADSLDLVEDLIVAGCGVALMPRDRAPRPGVSVVPLPAPGARLRTFAVARRGQERWPALRSVLDAVTAATAEGAPGARVLSAGR